MRALGEVFCSVKCVPLLLLMFRDLKQNINRLATLAAALLLFRILDLYWNVGPLSQEDPHAGFSLSPLDCLAFIGIGGIWYAIFSRALAARPALEPVEESEPKQHEAHAS